MKNQVDYPLVENTMLRLQTVLSRSASIRTNVEESIELINSQLDNGLLKFTTIICPGSKNGQWINELSDSKIQAQQLLQINDIIRNCSIPIEWNIILGDTYFPSEIFPSIVSSPTNNNECLKAYQEFISNNHVPISSLRLASSSIRREKHINLSNEDIANLAGFGSQNPTLADLLYIMQTNSAQAEILLQNVCRFLGSEIIMPNVAELIQYDNILIAAQSTSPLDYLHKRGDQLLPVIDLLTIFTEA